MPSQPPRVFISYSHDSHDHEERVLALAERLRKDGVDAQLDQYVAGTPPEGWPRWMLDRLDWADFVLVVCTETYYRRFRGHAEAGKGKGADWEGNLVTTEIYNAKSKMTKFAPVLFDGQNEQFIPEPVSGHTHYLLDSQDNYANLYASLTRQAGITPGELGSLRTLARNPVEPLRFDVSDMSACQLPLSNIPERNPFFTGREPVLAQLQEALATYGRAALSGLGGVGKTQTVVEYAHRHSAEYAHAFWATADSREAVGSGYAAIVSVLGLPEAGAQDQTLAVGAAQRWFSSHEDWLLILDNADDLTMAREFIPPGNNGHLLLTTRARALGTVARRLDIEEMGTEEGALFLLRRAKYIAADAPLEVAEPTDQARAREIAAQLDGLPLALDQAGAYIEETDCGFSGYLDLYRSHALELLRRRGELASNHHDPVASTWVLSFENIEKARPAAAELLRFCAFLHPDGIPEEVFSEGAPELGPVLGAVASDTLALNSCISEILKYSLLRRDPNAATLEIHRLVQTVLKQAMDEATQRLWAERTVRAVNRAFPVVDFSSWPVCERLLHQAQACAEIINQWSFGFPGAARLLNQAGFYLYERGRYTDVEPLFKRALAIRGIALGPEHPDTAASVNNMAVLYRAQGKYPNAEPLFERALAIWEKTLGPGHPYVATSLHNLGRLYRAQGKFAKAEPLYLRALAIRERVLGPKHPDVSPSLNDLALLYREQGQYAKAESLFERALAIRETLGADHPDVGASLNDLALLHHERGQYAKAEPLYERALAILENALGPEHPKVATTLNDLARLYRTQGQYERAEPLFERALAILEKGLGPEHPNVATSLENYALLLRNMGRSEEADPLEARARAIRTKSA
jgi:tetratricopeptide (TPR) repeat protein